MKTTPLVRNIHRACLLIAVLLAGACSVAPQAAGRDYTEVTIDELQGQLAAGTLTAEALTRWYLGRIAEIDDAGPELGSIIEINPEALAIARAADKQRNALSLKGPLHGVPLVLKANIDTGDEMATSAGSLALADHHASDDAFLVEKLRQSGAIILGKANLSEWANFRSANSSDGWSSLGGQTRNPYAIARNPCGSSSGSAVAVAANLAVLAVGTETNGSVVCPSGQNGVVGIKPSLGLVSRDGIIPIARSQDTAGPMARTVKDAALLLAVMAGPDPADPVTSNAPALSVDFVHNLSADALDGKRIGVLRSYHGAGGNPDVEQVLDQAINAIEAQGATVIDDIGIDIRSGESAIDAQWQVLLYEFKAGLNQYLQQSGAPFGSLAELIAYNKAHADRVMPHFGQDIFLQAQEKGPLTEPEYLAALKTSKHVTQSGIDSALARHDLDALIAPTNSPAWLTDHILGDHFTISSSSLAAISGYPNVTVPAGFVEGLPVGLSFIGANFNDTDLIEIAYAFEQATKVRKSP